MGSSDSRTLVDTNFRTIWRRNRVPTNSTHMAGFFNSLSTGEYADALVGVMDDGIIVSSGIALISSFDAGAELSLSVAGNIMLSPKSTTYARARYNVHKSCKPSPLVRSSLYAKALYGNDSC